MDQPKRRRGRPKGASRLNPDDDRTLIKVAAIVEAEAIAPSTAMHRFGFLLESAGLRRLQRKWKGRREWYLAEARRLAAAKADAARASYARHLPTSADRLRIAAQMKAYEKMLSPSVLRTAEQMAAMSAKLNGFASVRCAATIAALESPTFKALQSAQLGGRGLHFQSLQRFADITATARQLQGAIRATAMYDGPITLPGISKAYR